MRAGHFGEVIPPFESMLFFAPQFSIFILVIQNNPKIFTRKENEILFKKNFAKIHEKVLTTFRECAILMLSTDKGMKKNELKTNRS